MSITEEVAQCQRILAEAVDHFGAKIGVLFSGGKDSTALLSLVQTFFADQSSLPIITVDTGVLFPELVAFREALAKDWGLTVHRFDNKGAIPASEIGRDQGECCRELFESALVMAAQSLGLQAILLATVDGVTDEYFTKSPAESYVCVHPIRHFSPQHVWSYIQENNLPFCSLYSEGYTRLGCLPCSGKGLAVASRTLEGSANKEKIIHDLRQLGYF